MRQPPTVRAPLVVVLISFLCAAPLWAEDWPGWRGPTGMGHTRQVGLPTAWGGPDNHNVLWKVPLVDESARFRLDHNQSSPVVWGDRIFVTLSYWPEGKTNKDFSEHRVVCFRLRDGNKLWDTPVQPGGWLLNDFRGGGYACPTPAVDAERVYVVFGSAVIAALTHQGKLVWRREIDSKNFDVAIGASPVLYGDGVLMMCDKVGGQSSLMAFDRASGDLKWEQKRPSVGFAHSTPVFADVDGKTQMLVAASNALQGLDPTSGQVLWSCAARGDTASPVLGGGIIYCDSGRGGPGTAVLAGGMGDVSRTHVKWTKQVPEGFSSPIVAGDQVYRLHNPGLVASWKLTTGEEVYKERLPGITSTAASPIATPEGRIYFASAGKSYVVQAGPEFKVLATNDLGDPCHASPAVAERSLILKGGKFLYRIDAKPSVLSVKDTAEDLVIDTDCLQARIRKKGYVSGIAAGSLVDKKTGARDAGFGLHIMDFLLGPGWRDDGYSRDKKHHGDLPKHYVEGPQICTQAKELAPQVTRGDDFVAVRLRFRFTQPAKGYKAGSLWEQVLVFQPGVRYVLSSEQVTSANDVDNVFYRIDMPGHIKHKRGDTFDKVYLSYHGVIKAEEFFNDFAPDDRFLYQRREGKIPERVIRAYQVKIGGRPGPWLAGMTLDPAAVFEAWCHQRGYVCFIQELHGKPVKAGETFGAAYIVGYFDDIPAMEKTYDRYKGTKGIAVADTGFRLTR
jgi:outer membrane protein assembly factor BamB